MLYFLQPAPANSYSGLGQLWSWPAWTIRPPTSEPLAVTTPPTLPVRTLNLLPDKTVAGIWQAGTALEDYMVLERYGGLPYFKQDGRWSHPVAGLWGDGRRLSAIAASPDYVRDETLWVNVVGLGIFKSTDGGQLWRPSSAGLENMRLKELLVSPGFARDQTLFAVGDGWLGGLHRSQDGGQTWQQLSLPSSYEPYLAAISSEFEQDHSLLATVFKEQQELYLSEDGGNSWVRLPDGPNERPWTMLSLAPNFTKWQIAFAWQMAFTDEDQGLLYRSDNGGQSWTVVLNTGGPWQSAQLVYEPDNETERSLFLLVMPYFAPGYNTATGYNVSGPPDLGGKLYRSTDGGQSWSLVKLPQSVSPTALAISPDFVQDGLIYLGTVDGEVIALEAEKLE